VALILEGLGGHRERRIFGEEGDHLPDIPFLEGVGEARDEFALAPGARERRRFAATGGHLLIDVDRAR
jgi:hypothetical protein